VSSVTCGQNVNGGVARAHRVSTMIGIRIFLWGLVAAMTMQGWLHADDYGAAPTLFGGMSLTMAVWRESAGESVRSFFWRPATFTGLPRAVVRAAVRETARHPSIHSVPALRKAVAEHEKSWSAFREAEIGWLLSHVDVVGALQSEPEARELWLTWDVRVNASAVAVDRARSQLCLTTMMSKDCKARQDTLDTLEHRWLRELRVQLAWSHVLRIAGPTHVWDWWNVTQERVADGPFPAWTRALTQLHNVSDPRDLRIAGLLRTAGDAARQLTADPWLCRLVESLLVGELWAACLGHVGARESRVRELMAATGVAELMTAQERIFNASLRVATTDAERALVREWFGEMMSYAWWPSDELPSVTRRCLGTQAGDCARIGPTEIASLSAQWDERVRVTEDWTRRLFIGMWNALPALALLFVVELVGLCVERRLPHAAGVVAPQPQTMVLRLEMPRADGGVVTRDLPLLAQ